MDTKQKISLISVISGVAVFAYGCLSSPPELSLVELLLMDEALQQAYYNKADIATLLKFCGLFLIGLGLVSFIVIRSIKIHKSIQFRLRG
jgi:hypothetical protein